MTNTNWVILVDAQDREIGVAEKLLAHQQAKLHRAFSIFIFRKQNQEYQLLLQQRNLQKYHGGGLWSNTCCSHPKTGEALLATAQTRLQQEMGIVTPLTIVGRFHYQAQVGSGLVENEMDYVLTGIYNEEPMINQQEVSNYRWMALTTLQTELHQRPQAYTAWLAQALEISLTALLFK